MPTKPTDRKPVYSGSGFDRWMDLVDAKIARLTNGLHAVSLPECPYLQWYADGATVQSAAERAVSKWNRSKVGS
jgi:hypothetical protein